MVKVLRQLVFEKICKVAVQVNQNSRCSRKCTKNSTSSQGFKSVDVRENVQGSSASQPKTVDVREKCTKFYK